MAEGSIIREYMVGLGFEVNQGELHSFEDGAARAARMVSGLGANIATTFLAIAAAVGKGSKAFEALHYVSQQTNTSVRNLQAVEYAGQQAGLQLGQTTAMVQNLARAIRTNPGVEGVLGGLGIQTAGRQTSEIMDDLLDKLSQMQPYMAAQYGQLFGIDSDSLTLLTKNRDIFRSAEAARLKMGLDAKQNPDAIGDQAAKLGRDRREIGAREDVIKGQGLNRFGDVTDGFAGLLNRVATLVESLDEKTGGLSTILGGTAAAAGASGLGRAALGRLFGGGAVAAGEVAVAGEGVAALPVIAIVTTVIAILAGLGYAVLKTDTGRRIGDRVKQEGGHAVDGVRAWAQRHLMPEQKAADAHVAFANPTNLRSWGDTPVRERFSKGHSVGNFADFGSNDAAGLSAGVGQILRYFDRDHLQTIHDIVSKFAPEWAKGADGKWHHENNTGAYIKGMSDRLGVGEYAPLDLHNPEIMAKWMAAQIQQEQGKQPYSPEAIRSAVDYRFAKERVPASGPTQNIHVETHMRVEGSSDPEATGRSVVRQQGSIPGQIIRNLAGGPS